MLWMQYFLSRAKLILCKLSEMHPDPGGQVTLSTTPWTTVAGREFGFGYRGVTQVGKRFTRSMKLGERVYLDGPRKISLTISAEQIQ